MYGTKLTDKDVGAFITNWDTTKGVGPDEAWEEALYDLPVNWEDRMTEEGQRAEIEKRRVESLARITQFEARIEGLVRPQQVDVPLDPPAEPKGDWPDSVMPTVATHTVDREHLYDPSLTGCPVCEAFVPTECWWGGEDAWTCASCGYSPEYTLEVDPSLPSVRREATLGGRSGITTYRDDELAAAQVIYHEGEPVMPEAEVVTVDEFPWSWDSPIV